MVWDERKPIYGLEVIDKKLKCIFRILRPDEIQNIFKMAAICGLLSVST